MEIYSPGEILLLKFPFTEEADTKRRPALVLFDVGDDDVVVVRITTHITRTRFDLEIKEWKSAGLRAASVVRLTKLATIEKSLIDRRLGRLTAQDWKLVENKLHELVDLVVTKDSK